MLSYSTKTFYAWLPLCLCLFLFKNLAAADTTNSSVILGYDLAIDNPIWRNELVGFGVKNQLRALLQENLPSLELMDEKTLASLNSNAYRLNLDNNSKPAWVLNAASTSPEQLKTLSQQLNIGSIYWVKITKFAKPKSKLSIALWSSQTESVELNLEVCRYTASEQTTQCEEGFGSASTNMDAFIYIPVDHSNHQQAHFDQAAVGKISYQALKMSVSALLAKE